MTSLESTFEQLTYGDLFFLSYAIILTFFNKRNTIDGC